MSSNVTLKSGSETILGLDIGTNSIGWALLSARNGKPEGLLGMGVRIFPEGVDGGLEGLRSGRDVSRGVQRREARQRRRMLWRRQRRLAKLARLLQSGGLLPPGKLSTGDERHEYFLALDKNLFPHDVRHTDSHTLPYRLRAKAIDEKLEPYEIGRSLYHLAQRRGFLSNRNTPVKDGEKEGEVKQKIETLRESLQQSGSRTLGEYFSKLDPTLERIRGRYTDRKMYLKEFESVWEGQKSWHPGLMNDGLKKLVYKVIFYQRPLKSQAELIGLCELEKGRKRAPMALLSVQRFRLLQKVNDLKASDIETGEFVKLSDENRCKLAEALNSQGDMKFSDIRALLGLLRYAKFNFEKQDGDNKLIGNRTVFKIKKAIGEKWDGWDAQKREQAVEDLRSIQKEEVLVRRGVEKYVLTLEEAQAFSKITLEDGYCALSRQALHKILPKLEEGMAYATARKELYGDLPASEPLDRLPSLRSAREHLPGLRNPAVERALTELRKVVNGVLRRYGKPNLIRVELARDLKKSRSDRKEHWKRNETNRKARERAAELLMQECNIQNPSRGDIEKYLLWEECGGQCPYTGKTISINDLFGAAPNFDVEHIIPFSRCLDDSFLNKTLCEVAENRNIKRNQTPFEAYGSVKEKWTEIMGRVKRFRGDAGQSKLRRFQLESLDEIDGFISRQLNDTRYASKLAVRFLGLLYGAQADAVDAQGNKRIQPGRGQVTYFLRNELDLNSILGDGGTKNRDDHRHHAVDAVTIALTDSTMVKVLSLAASRANQDHRRRFGKVDHPWVGFFDQVKERIDSMVVSHRPTHKVNGPLHEDSNYGKLRVADNKEFVVIRKPLENLTESNVKNIVDQKIRRLVENKLEGQEPSKVFKSPENHPKLKAKNGREIPIHKVRIRVSERTVPIGKKGHQRRVLTGDNHHVEILEVKKKGKMTWEGVIVTRLEAMRRLASGKAFIQRNHGPEKKFLFALHGGDTISMKDGDGKEEIYVIRVITKVVQNDREYVNLAFIKNNDAREKKEIIKAKQWKTALVNKLRELGCKKVVVTPTGEVQRSNE